MPNRKSALNRGPKVTTQPVTTGNEQTMGKISPGRVAMERLSPGVYRSASGGLVSGQGRPIERQPQAPMPDMQNPWNVSTQPNMPMDKMYREPPMYQWPGMPQMPQPSANMGGQYRLSPGMYGSREQAMQQYNDQLRQMELSAVPQYNKR